MRPFHMTSLKSRILSLAACLTLTTVLLVGCAKPEPKMITVLDPVEVKHLSLEGQLMTSRKSDSISPDGKYLLAALRGAATEKMVALPIAGEGEAIPLYSMDAEWTRNNLVQWYPVGWTSDTTCLFIVHGWQNQGEHEDERGTAIFTGDIESKESSLVGWLDVPTRGYILEEAVLNQGGKVHIRVSGKLLEFDVTSRDLSLIRDGFPSYYGISRVALSPAGDKVLYSVYEEDKSGVFIVDVASGEERPLLLTDDSLSFFPSWSPSGEYILAYTAEQMQDPILDGVTRFNFIPAEDGPIPSARTLTILDIEGNIVKTITMEDEYLSHAAWLADGTSLVFVSGPVTFGKWGEVTSMEYSAIWIDDVSEDTGSQKAADISAIEKTTLQKTTYIFPVASLPDGTGALVNISGAEEASVWRVSTAGAPEKVTDGWWETARLAPMYQDSVVGVASSGDESNVWLVRPDSISMLGEPSPTGTNIIAYNTDHLIVGRYDFDSKVTEATVYKMLTEIAQD